MSLSTSPLDARHRSLQAKMAAFGGWTMPLAYPQGTLAEHRACRSGVALFDVSHLGTVRVTGTGALALLQDALTNDLRRIGPGRAQYTHLLDPADGSVEDDLLVWWVAPERFDVMPNASNTAQVRQAVGGTDVTAERAVLAVQGPQARSCLASVFPEAGAVGRFAVRELDWQGTTCVVAGTGYTGEDGVEMAVPEAAAPALWDALVGAGAVPAGLGARDTLRLEAGLPLHGHELGPGITPLQAGLGWVVGWDKPDFRGRAALEGERARGPRRLLRGVELEGRRPPRAGSAVLSDGTVVGTVTSGNFSPTLERGIALCFVPPDLEVGASVEIDLRGTRLPGRLVRLPFVSRRRKVEAGR
ncbi:MAG: glycine cleavage system aminomethyltransferase GcvT [Actinobacteria bacterium]|nr:glycine cleavage system aminomethyltransferase GcvT [Actinomycetota bacterium]